MAIVWADVVAWAPELTNTPLAVQTLSLARAHEIVDPAIFCGDTTSSYTLALIYMAAHIATLQAQASGAGSAAGLVASESIGGLSVSYKSGFSDNPTMGGYERTGWGQNYIDLVRTSPCYSGLGIMVL